ncbi:hypothetical protein FH972_021511 [Carpinus fangiana]|uniref:diacylglycerol O-acyltransferase n=1 Tax=Carpinus fangiana TaxID=176857 RepID=A0A5N6KQ44_9ROSI|nr:hypothetical protein FH972_021511 [Carpinus fangiana]
MAAVIANGGDHSLPTEPSQPLEREAEGLPPKSYAAAAEEATRDSNDKAGDTRSPNGILETPMEGNKGRLTKQNLDAASTKPPVPHKKEHLQRPSSSRSDGKANGIRADLANLYGDGVLEREYEADGHVLVSTRAPKGYYSALARDREEEKPRKTNTTDLMDEREELVSGRTAGARWATSAIRWAPLNVPIQRRLQTLAILAHTLSIPGLVAFFFMLCTIPLLWPIVVPYLLYCLLSSAGTDGKLSRRSEWYRRLPWWSLFASYFPARLHRTQELEPTRKYIFGYHPHGIISHGAFAAFATEAMGFSQLFPGITNTLLTLDSNFRMPLYRDHALRLGLASVSRESCENLLNQGGINGEGMGRAITIVVGGARESLDAQPHYMRLVLKRRKGFVKLAIRNGADLVPVLGFGENELYEQIKSDAHPYLHKTQMLIKKIAGFTIPLFHARGVFNYDVGMLPYRRPVNIVVGRPIRIEQDRNPSDDHINAIHEQYVQELERLWHTWKDTFAKERAGELEIVE